MVNYFRKMKLAIWVVVILTVTNLATIATIVYHSYERGHKPPFQENSKDHQGPGKFFLQKELGLNPQQEEKFLVNRNTFFNESKIVFTELESKRNAIIKEISKENPDTVLLFQYSNDIGKLHATLKGLTIRHLLVLKKICNKEQNSKLDSLYQRLIGPEGGMRHRNFKEGWKRDSTNLKVH